MVAKLLVTRKRDIDPSILIGTLTVILAIIGLGLIMIAGIDAGLQRRGASNQVDQIMAKLDCRQGSVSFTEPTKLHEGRPFALYVNATYTNTSRNDVNTRVEGVKICSRLIARLEGDDYAYSLDEAYDATQLLPSEGTVEWHWTVTPKGYGDLSPLTLVLYTAESQDASPIRIGNCVVVPTSNVTRDPIYDAASMIKSFENKFGFDSPWLYAVVAAGLGALGRPAYRLTIRLRREQVQRRRRTLRIEATEKLRQRKAEQAKLRERLRREEEAIAERLRQEEEAIAAKIRLEDRIRQLSDPIFQPPRTPEDAEELRRLWHGMQGDFQFDPDAEWS